MFDEAWIVRPRTNRGSIGRLSQQLRGLCGGECLQYDEEIRGIEAFVWRGTGCSCVIAAEVAGVGAWGAWCGSVGKAGGV